MSWLLAAVAGIAAVEVLLRLPLAETLVQYRQTVTKVQAVITSSRISDHWKEQAVPAYAVRLLGLTARTALYLLLVMLPVLVFIAIATAIDVPFLEFMLSLTGIVFMSAVAIAYARIRKYVSA